MDRHFWKDRKVFVTGHTGFKGSWLSLWLRHLSADVVGYALPAPTQPSLFASAELEADMLSIQGDVRDYTHLRDALDRHRPEIVFHLAAQSVVRASYRDPIETYSTNVMGTVNLLEALRQTRSRAAVINVTSDKCYANNEWVWGYRESDRLGGRDPYSNSKACSELVTQSFANSFFSDDGMGTGSVASIATARAGNVIGGGDWTPDQLIPDIITAFRNGHPAILRNPESVRPWQFVLDCLNGYLTLAERLSTDARRYDGAWNFGPTLDGTATVRELVERLAQRWPGGAGWQQDTALHPPEAAILRLDTSKATHLLGWRPCLDLAGAVDWTVEWYGRYFDGASARELCIQQIDRFETLQRGGSCSD